uniref:BTB/POZ domain-containing protein 7 n=1 Tax=Haemonchus contortus TaxID=6289 RepID=A0A7I4YWH3_HAECO
MGGGSSSLRARSRSSTDLERLKPTAEQRTPKTRSRLASLAQSSSKHLPKLPFKRKGDNRDKVKPFRDLIATWPVHDVETLYRELETSRILSLLQNAADSARPPLPCIGEELYSSKSRDLVLKIGGDYHRVHRRLVVSRCSVIAEYLSGKETMELDLAVFQEKRFTPQDIGMFITYLYTDLWPGSADMLQSLRECFGCNQDLLTGLRKAEEMAFEDGDLTIVLTSSDPTNDDSSKAHPPEYSFRCDSSILSSRSAVFRGLLNHVGEDGRIVLDEALLPRGFAPVVVHFIYTDELDFSMVPDTIISESSLSEARAIVAGRSPHSPLHRAIQLIHIAKFFALEKLVQLCEDVIVASLCPESCVSICTWACDGGSQYVARCAQSYLESEFSQIASTHCLFDISLESLVSCVESQFLQATEVDVLEAVIRWGEHELLHRMEEREPNVVADTSHSISRRGVKRGDLSGAELREILAPITAHLRIDYVLPPFHQSLNAAYSRGILDRAPLRDDLVCPSTSEIIPDIHWFRPDQDAPGPRFYVPYYKVTKEHLRDVRERDGIACIPHPLLVVDCAFHVVVTNLMPDLISEEKFNEVQLEILTAIESADCQHHIRFFPRAYHRRMAVQLIALRVLRAMDIDPRCVDVRITSDLPEDSCAAEPDRASINCSQPSLHWPDIMTLERKKS